MTDRSVGGDQKLTPIVLKRNIAISSGVNILNPIDLDNHENNLGYIISLQQNLHNIYCIPRRSHYVDGIDTRKAQKLNVELPEHSLWRLTASEHPPGRVTTLEHPSVRLTTRGHP